MRTFSSSINTEIAKTDGAMPVSCCALYLAGGTLRFCDFADDLSFQGNTLSARGLQHSAIRTFFKNKVDNCNLSIDNTDLAMSAYYAASRFAGVKAEIFKIFLAKASATVNGSVSKTATTIPYNNLSGTFPSSGYFYLKHEKVTYTGNTGSSFTGCSVRLNDSASGASISGAYPIDGYPSTDDKILQFSGFMDTPKVTEKNFTVRIVNMFDRAKSQAPWRLYQSRCNWDFCSAGYCTYNGGSKVRGTADSGTTTSLTDTMLAGTASFVGAVVKILSGTNKGSVRYISTHNTSAGQITFDAMPAACDTTTAYLIECDKSRAACAGFSNEANFGGYDEMVVITNDTSNIWVNLYRKMIANQKTDMRIVGPGNAIPLVYGTARVAGTLLDLYMSGAGTYDHVYGICEGEIDSITSCLVANVDTSFTGHAGASGQTFDFHGETKYYKKLAVATFLHSYLDDTTMISVAFAVRGLKVQKYLSNGTPDGSPAWSDNPAWCILDFLMNRSMQPYASSQINFAKWKTAADLCDTLGYRVNLSITDRQDEKQILDWMLTACRGFFTYTSGKMELNIEQAWSGGAAHVFTMDNIVNDSFEGPYENEVNETPNRIIVKYIDEQIRQNVALITTKIAAGVHITSMPYGDLNGSFTSTGTIYIGSEAVAYTANSGSALTVDWTPANTYISGYPIFQGTQAFPELTQIYNDWDDQNNKKRTIDKEIDGRAIPTPDQALKVAEWEGRKAIEGNVFCKLKGMMDSLVLTVGDEVEISHDVPGWTSQKFRLIEASESQDEEIEYICRVYDPSLYVETAGINPGPALTTALPNPYAAVGSVTSIVLTEGGYVGADGTYVPTVNVTYTPPSDIFWGSARIQVKVNAGTYKTYPGDDKSGGAGYVIDGMTAGFVKGDTVYVKVISINTQGLVSDPATAPTQSTTITGSAIPTLTTPTGLALLQGGTSWNGRTFTVIWTPQGSGSLDPSYITNEVVIATGGVDRYTFKTRDNSYTYIFGDGEAAALDSYIVAANGACTVKVRRVSTLAAASSYATLAITNAAPAQPANLVSVGLIRGAYFQWDKNTESDFLEYQVRTKITSGGSFGSWVKQQDPNYTRMMSDAERSTYGNTPDIYIEVKTLDLFGNASSVASTYQAAVQIASSEVSMIAAGYNQIINSDFENGFDGWLDNGGAGSVVVATSPKSGSYAAENTSGNYLLRIGSIYIPIQRDRVLMPECYLKEKTAGSSGICKVSILFYDSSKAYISEFVIANSVQPGSSFTYYNGACGAGQTTDYPSNAVYYRPAFVLNGVYSGGWTAGNRVHQIQGFRVREVIESAYIKDLAVDKLVTGSFTSQAVTLAVSEGAGDSKIQAGKTDFGDNTAGFILGIDDSDSNKVKFEIGDSSHSLKWDGSALTVHGQIQTASGSGKRIVLNASTNEAEFYGDRGDSTIEKLAGIGINQSGSDYIIIDAGNINSGNSRIAIQARSYASLALMAISNNDSGVLGKTYSTSTVVGGIKGIALGSSGSGVGVAGYALSNGYGGHFWTNDTAAGSALLLALTTSGSHVVTASGGTWTPSVPGFYNFVDTYGSPNDTVTVEFYISGAWRTPCKVSGTGYYGLYGMVYCDGSNVRLKNSDTNDHTVYWQRF